MSKHSDKSEYYARMGWCECNHCRIIFYEYEDYETHKCEPPMMGVYVSDNVNWSVQDGTDS